MKRILKTRLFCRWMRKTDLDDRLLRKAIEEMERGLVDVDLGGGVYKKRIASPGRGKSGSTRTLIATSTAARWIFLYGYEKNEKDNITQGELAAWKLFARDLLECSEAHLETLKDDRELEELGDE